MLPLAFVLLQTVKYLDKSEFATFFLIPDKQYYDSLFY